MMCTLKVSYNLNLPIFQILNFKVLLTLQFMRNKKKYLMKKGLEYILNHYGCDNDTCQTRGNEKRKILSWG